MKKEQFDNIITTMKKSAILGFALLMAVSATAVPAHPGKRTAQQADGTTLEYRVVGDERYHYMVDADGDMLVRNEAGFLEKAGKEPTEEQIRAQRAASKIQPKAAPRRVGEHNLISKGLVILVNYKDTKFKAANTKAEFEDLFNGDNYTYNGATGSVRQYYSDQSNGQFKPTLDVYGPVTLSNNKSYYGGNDSQGYDKRLGEMVAEACKAAYQQYNINLNDYDANGDGYVDFIDIMYAGYGEADSDDADAVWPCEWELSSSDYGNMLTLGGKKIDLFSCHQELDGYGTMKGKRAGIGTPCHEFSHVFGLPDFYDTTYKNATLGAWDIMDAGSYNNSSRTPPGFSGYERMFAGWAKPRLLNSAETVTLQELQGSQEVLVVSTSGTHNLDAINPNPKTFYILENRQQKSWDKYLPGHGMLIWKIQYNATKWEQNTVNNAAVSKQGVAIMAADGKVKSTTYQGQVSTEGDDGDPYPGSTKKTSYEISTTYPITDITESADGIISFKFMGGASIAYSVAFNAGEHGTCETSSLKEAEAGAGIVLPAVTTDAGYIFLGWATSNTLLSPDAGHAGDVYLPKKNITLYALYMPENCNIEWELENVTVTPRQESISASGTLKARVTPNEGYEMNIYDITVSMGMHTLAASKDYTFSNDTLTIPDVRDHLNITIIAREEGKIQICDNYSHTFIGSASSGENMLDDYTWLIHLRNSSYFGYETTRGAQFGTRTEPALQVSLTSENTINCAIQTVAVNAARTAISGQGTTPTVEVLIDGTPIGAAQTLTQAASDYSFTNSINARGNIEIRIDATNAGVYIKKIEIQFEGQQSALESIEAEDRIVAVYDLFGQTVDRNALQAGSIYIVQTDKGTRKIKIQ